MVVSLPDRRDTSIRGTEVWLGSRQREVVPEGKCHTGLCHAPLWLCHTWESQTRALWQSKTGLCSGCWTLEGTGSSSCCLSLHSGTRGSGVSYSQTTGWCTDCTERWTENILLFFSYNVLEAFLRQNIVLLHCYYHKYFLSVSDL